MSNSNRITPLSVQAGVWEADLKQGPKIVLLALIDHLNFKRKDWRVWPSTTTLASMCGAERKAVERNLRTLEQAKLITTTKVSCPNGQRNEYEIAVDALMGYATKRTNPKQRDGAKRTNPMVQNAPTPRCKKHHEVAKGNRKDEVQISAASRKDNTTPKTGKVGLGEKEKKQRDAKVFSAYERGAKKFSVGEIVLTPKEKRQLKDAASHFADCSLDPDVVIEKVVSQWDRFKREAPIMRGYEGSFRPGLSPNPSPNSLVLYRQEAVEFYRRKVLNIGSEADKDFDNEVFELFAGSA